MVGLILTLKRVLGVKYSQTIAWRQIIAKNFIEQLALVFGHVSFRTKQKSKYVESILDEWILNLQNPLNGHCNWSYLQRKPWLENSNCELLKSRKTCWTDQGLKPQKALPQTSVVLAQLKGVWIQIGTWSEVFEKFCLRFNVRVPSLSVQERFFLEQKIAWKNPKFFVQYYSFSWKSDNFIESWLNEIRTLNCIYRCRTNYYWLILDIKHINFLKLIILHLIGRNFIN